jgi:hypothetical protein
MKTHRVLLTAALALLVAWSSPALGQRKGDYLTEGELDIVRDVREIDKRADVFLTVADRRLAVLADQAAEPDGRLSKYMGPMPTGSQVELLDDYRHAVEELMIKLEDEFERKGLSAELKKGLEAARDRVAKQIQQIEAIKPKLTGDAAQFAGKAIEVARELQDGAIKALAAK